MILYTLFEHLGKLSKQTNENIWLEQHTHIYHQLINFMLTTVKINHPYSANIEPFIKIHNSNYKYLQFPIEVFKTKKRLIKLIIINYSLWKNKYITKDKYLYFFSNLMDLIDHKNKKVSLRKLNTLVLEMKLHLVYQDQIPDYAIESLEKIKEKTTQIWDYILYYKLTFEIYSHYFLPNKTQENPFIKQSETRFINTIANNILSKLMININNTGDISHAGNCLLFLISKVDHINDYDALELTKNLKHIYLNKIIVSYRLHNRDNYYYMLFTIW